MVGRDDAKPVIDLGIDDDDQGEREQAIDKEVAVGQVQLQHFKYILSIILCFCLPSHMLGLVSGRLGEFP